MRSINRVKCRTWKKNQAQAGNRRHTSACCHAPKMAEKRDIRVFLEGSGGSSVHNFPHRLKREGELVRKFVDGFSPLFQ